MVEESEFAHRSTRPDLMHGCGHDGHITILLGATRYLAETRNFDGTVYVIFQPGEEGFAGAKAMIDDGLFERFPADEVDALHNWPGLPAGKIGLNDGPMMAAADRVEITVCGKGGHGAHPHLTFDPVLAAAHIITAAQSIVARNVAPLDSAVLSLCAIHAGLQVVAVVWLLWLAWKIAPAPPPGEGPARPPMNFVQAALFQWVNPKAWMIAGAAIAGYTQPHPRGGRRGRRGNPDRPGDPGANETPGLGARIAEPWFRLQFRGKRAPLEFDPEGTRAAAPDRVDAVTGATISSRAVRDLVNRAAAEAAP